MMGGASVGRAMTVESEDTQAKKKGRPSGKRGTFSFRVTASLRSQLEAAASNSQRPVSEEIESRLERSFDDSERKILEQYEELFISTYFGSREMASYASQFTSVIKLAEIETGNKFNEDDYTRKLGLSVLAIQLIGLIDNLSDVNLDRKDVLKLVPYASKLKGIIGFSHIFGTEIDVGQWLDAALAVSRSKGDNKER